ncbi:hypothetical protein CH302_01860 [Rhodococcus sp. 15-2388-1-1a]|nr:hypothetical protein CH302_01860 [Rhodococcus sp. 15-2388-1-1a]
MEGDVLVSQTSDGTDLNLVWAEFITTLSIYNEERSSLAALLSYQTTRQIDAVPQSVAGAQFEVASEFGVPQGHAIPNDVIKLGYDYEDYDIATRYTWKYLRDADARQVAAVHNSVLEGANRATTTAVLKRLFDPERHQSTEGNTVYGLYNADGMYIPPYLGDEFDPATDTHYLTTGSAILDPSDVETLMDKVTRKGFSNDTGRQLVILANPLEAKRIAQFRAGEPGADGVEAHFDFIPSDSAPPRLLAEQIVGDVVPAKWNNLPVLGSYGESYVIQSAFVPKGYVAVVASAGPNAEGNPIGFRVHANPAYQGLRLIAGSDSRYPVVGSIYAIGYGTGVRYRGGAAVTQVTTGAYTVPTFPK